MPKSAQTVKELIEYIEYIENKRQPEDSADRCVCPNCGQPHNPKLIKSDHPMEAKYG